MSAPVPPKVPLFTVEHTTDTRSRVLIGDHVVATADKTALAGTWQITTVDDHHQRTLTCMVEGFEKTCEWLRYLGNLYVQSGRAARNGHAL